MKNNKGITMISLVITIIVLLIVTSITIYNGVEQLGIKRVNSLYADIDSISTKVADYYLKNESLPIYENNKYVDSKEELEALFRRNGATENITNVNDGEDYYVLKLSKLDNLTLNYGEDYIDWEDTSTADDIQNLYIINSVTHQIYFPHGVRSGNDYYFVRSTDENVVSPIELEDIDANWTMNLTNISKNIIDEDNISIVADVTLSGLAENYDLNSLEYVWAETNDETNLENMLFTKFDINNISEGNITATLSSKALSNTVEKYYLWVKATDKNGKSSYKYSNRVLISSILLPSEYQKVEYIESTGTQTIITDIPTRKLITVIIDTQFTTTTNGAQVLFYGKNVSSGNWFGRVTNRYSVGGGNSLNYLGTERKVLIAQFNSNGINLKIDEASTTRTGTHTTTGTYKIFENASYKASAKVYSLIIKENEDIIANFIPCYHKLDNVNVNGLYDLVENVFYTHQGTDNFLVGENVY